jgi:tRNA pseudouridine13 synthase
MLEGSHSLFVAQPLDDTLRQRLLAKDIHPTGPLPGMPGLSPEGEALVFEDNVLSTHTALIEALKKEGLKSARRPLRFIPQDIHWEWIDDATLQLTFTLPAGAYATAVLRELAEYEDRRGVMRES